MAKNYFIFIKRLTVFSIVVVILSFVVSRLLPKYYLSPALPYIILFFFIVTSIFHFIVLKSSEKKTSNFIRGFMLGTVIKLSIYFSALLIYVLIINKYDAIPFILSFFIYYLIYTIFEIILILRVK
jgi:hypothetical protein